MATKALICAMLLWWGGVSFAQNRIEYRSDYGHIYPESPSDITLTSNVQFIHNGMTMFCDSAIYNQKDNYFFAFGNINMYQGDSIHLTGDELHYYGNDKIGDLWGRVVTLEDGGMTLQTDRLYLDRNVNTVEYNNGADMWDEENTLVSRQGVYFIDSQACHFYLDVEMTNKDVVINSDTLFYYSKTKMATFSGPTTVVMSDSTKVNTTFGSYDTKNDIVYSTQRSNILTNTSIIRADTIYYERNSKNGYSYGNIYVEDTSDNVFMNCDSIKLNTIDTISTAIITGNIYSRQVDDGDTLYFHSDTMKVEMDTAFKVKNVFAFPHCKFYRIDLQGASEYIHYNALDSTLMMLITPVLWAEESQMTSDTIFMHIKDRKIDNLNMYPNVFLLQNSDTNTNEFFNQVTGKTLEGFFKNNKIDYAVIDGNTNSIYFLWEENKKKKQKKLTGVNIGTSKILHLYFSKGKINKMSALQNPDFYMDDYFKVKEEDRHLKGFVNHELDRPKAPIDIFIPRNCQNGTKYKVSIVEE